jgi:putative flippase GtrA
MQLIKALLRKQAVRQFIKYIIVGTIVTGIDMIALHLSFRVLTIPIKISVIIGFMCGNISSLSSINTILSAISPRRSSPICKVLYHQHDRVLWTLALMTLFFEHLNLFSGITRYNYLLCKAIVAVIVMFWNFMIIRHWTLADYTLPYLPSLEDYGKENKCFLSVVIPAFNERDRLPQTLDDVFKWLESKSIDFEVLVINDGSTDGMVLRLKEEFNHKPGFKIWSLPQNMGKGAAVKEGMLLAGGEYRLFMDADNQIRIHELDSFLKKADPRRVIIGSKYAASGSQKDEIASSRVFVSRLGNLIIKLLLGLEIADTQCGFKLFPAQIAESVFRMQRLKRFAYDMEILSWCSFSIWRSWSCPSNSIPLPKAG